MKQILIGHARVSVTANFEYQIKKAFYEKYGENLENKTSRVTSLERLISCPRESILFLCYPNRIADLQFNDILLGQCLMRDIKVVKTYEELFNEL